MAKNNDRRQQPATTAASYITERNLCIPNDCEQATDSVSSRRTAQIRNRAEALSPARSQPHATNLKRSQKPRQSQEMKLRAPSATMISRRIPARTSRRGRSLQLYNHPPPANRCSCALVAGSGNVLTVVSLCVDRIQGQQSHCYSPRHLTPPHPTSSHPYLTPPHLTQPHPTSPHLTPFRLTAPHLTSDYQPHHSTPPHLTWPHPTSPHTTSPHFTSSNQ